MAQRNSKPKKFFSQKAQMPFSFDEDVKNLWLLLVDCGGIWSYFFAFPSLQEQFFGIKYMREKQKKALFREIIAYILFFFFVLSFMG